MIAYLEGRLLEKTETGCVVLTPGGVGYDVALTVPLVAALPAVGEAVQFYIVAVVREDAFELYGLGSFEEREIFRTMIGISKLGPKTALAILSQFSVQDIFTIAAGEDPYVLTSVSGIGKKTAQHIFLELKYKLKGMVATPVAASLGASGAAVFRDALAGLTNLGYAEEEARPLLERILKEQPDLDVGEALRAALKEMAKER